MAGPFLMWCLRTESNRRSAGLQPAALPAELPRRGVTGGIRIRAFWATTRRSYQLSYGHMVTRTGFEPAMTGLKDR